MSLVFVLAALAFMVRTVINGRDEAIRALTTPDGGAIAGLFACATFTMVWIAAQWHGVLARLDRRFKLSPGSSIAMYFVGEIGKYLPGGIWPVVGRGELATKALQSSAPSCSPATVRKRPVAYASVLLSLAYLFLAGLLVAGVAASVAFSRQTTSKAPLLLLAFLPLGLVLLDPRIAVPALTKLALKFGQAQTIVAVWPQWNVSILSILRYVPAWAGISGATWCALQMLNANVSIAVIVGATCLSWVAGFLVLPAPGGLGAREAVFSALMVGSLAPAKVAGVAIVTRLAFVIVDALGAVSGALWLSATARRQASRETT